MTGGMLVAPVDDDQLIIQLVWLHETFVGLADATRLKGLVDA